jgi:POT family proton-dependent oligopeptide transporter
VVGGLIGLGLWLQIKRPHIRRPATAIGVGFGLALGLLAFFLFKVEGTDVSRLELDPSQIPALNPFMVMILIPLTSKGLYPLMDKWGFKPHPLRRMTIGMFVTGVSFVAVAIIQHFLDAGVKLHVFWQILPYLIITTAEVMVSITGLEFGYSQAPKRMKSVVMGFWLLTVAMGNVLVAALAGFKDLDAAAFFWVFAGLMGVAALGFGVRAHFYKYNDVTQ